MDGQKAAKAGQRIQRSGSGPLAPPDVGVLCHSLTGCPDASVGIAIERTTRTSIRATRLTATRFAAPIRRRTMSWIGQLTTSPIDTLASRGVARSAAAGLLTHAFYGVAAAGRRRGVQGTQGPLRVNAVDGGTPLVALRSLSFCSFCRPAICVVVLRSDPKQTDGASIAVRHLV